MLLGHGNPRGRGSLWLPPWSSPRHAGKHPPLGGVESAGRRAGAVRGALKAAWDRAAEGVAGRQVSPRRPAFPAHPGPGQVGDRAAARLCVRVCVDALPHPPPRPGGDRGPAGRRGPPDPPAGPEVGSRSAGQRRAEERVPASRASSLRCQPAGAPGAGRRAPGREGCSVV